MAVARGERPFRARLRDFTALRADVLADATDEESDGHADQAAELREAAGALHPAQQRLHQLDRDTGIAFFAGESTLGASASVRFAYGVPAGGLATRTKRRSRRGARPVSIDQHQFRADLARRVALGEGFLDRLVTASLHRLHHTEFEGESSARCAT